MPLHSTLSYSNWLLFPKFYQSYLKYWETVTITITTLNLEQVNAMCPKIAAVDPNLQHNGKLWRPSSNCSWSSDQIWVLIVCLRYLSQYYSSLWHFFQDSLKQVERLSAFLGVKCDSQFIQEVCDRCSFTKLKESYQLKKGADNKEVNPNEFAFRKGKPKNIFGSNWHKEKDMCRIQGLEVLGPGQTSLASVFHIPYLVLWHKSSQL